MSKVRYRQYCIKCRNHYCTLKPMRHEYYYHYCILKPSRKHPAKPFTTFTTRKGNTGLAYPLGQQKARPGNVPTRITTTVHPSCCGQKASKNGHPSTNTKQSPPITTIEPLRLSMRSCPLFREHTSYRRPAELVRIPTDRRTAIPCLLTHTAAV